PLGVSRSEKPSTHARIWHLRPSVLLGAGLPQPSEGAPMGALTSQMARQRRAETVRLLQSSWTQLSEGKYDLALMGFEPLVSQSKRFLTREEYDQALFGRGLSRFHQVGCEEALEDLNVLQREDTYYTDAL